VLRLSGQPFGIIIFLLLSPVVCYLISRYSDCTHVISRKTLRQFWVQHPDSENALARWFKIMQRHDFTSFETLRATFPTADKVGDFIVLNIGGNEYRLIDLHPFQPAQSLYPPRADPPGI
jgi:mRNA interferase HigB